MLKASGTPVPPTVSVPKEVVSTESSLVPGEDTIRVTISKLDDLMAQAGELIMAEISTEQHLTDVRALRDKMTRWPKLWREIKMLLPRLEGDAGRRLADLLSLPSRVYADAFSRCQCS